MADDKVLNARIKQKCDTLENWSNNNPVLLAGELAVVEIDTTDPANKQLPPIMFKIGDGATRFNSLGWASAKAADVYDWAKAATKPKYTASEVGAATPSDVSGALESAKDYADKNFLKTSGGTINGSVTVTETLDAKKITIDGKDITVSYATKDELAAETRARADADTALQSSISALSDNLTDYKTDNNAALKTTIDNLNAHIANKANPHNVTKTQVGLGNVANERQYSANNPNFGTDMPLMDGAATVGTKTTYSRSDHIHPTDTTRASAADLTAHINNTENPHGVTKVQVGLGNVDNTADANKHVKQADQDGAGNNIVNTYATKTALQEGLAGKAKTVTFDTYQAFVTAVNAYTKTQLNIGDNALIKTLGVPDMWVTRVDTTATPYTYTTDQAIVDKLNTTTGLQVGYFNFAKLETTKVDLDPYQTKTDNSLTTTAKTVVGAINENKGAIDKIKNGTTKVKSAESADNATKLNNQAASYYLNYTNATNKPKLDTTATTSQATSAKEEISGTIKLHKISKTGSYGDLGDTPVTVATSGLPTKQAGIGLTYFGSGASDAPTALQSNPFLLHTIKPTSGATYQAILNGNSIYSRTQSQNTWGEWVEYDLSTFAKKTDIPSKASDSDKLGGQLPAYYLNYTNATNKPKITTNNTASQTVLSGKEISGTIQLHKIASTGKFDDLVDSPVHQTDTAGEDGLNNPMYNECGLYSVPVNIDYSPFHLGSKNNQIDSALDRMWLTVTIAQETGDASQGLSTITQQLVYGSKIAVRSQKYQTSPSAIAWTSWVVYDLSKVLTEITVSSAGDGFVSAVTRDTTNKNKISVTKRAIANSDLPNSGVTAGVYSAVQVNAKGVVTAGNQMIEWGVAGQTTPSATLAIGGLFFELKS